VSSQLQITISVADCGRRFRTDGRARNHEVRCWKSPALKTCKTCKHARRVPYEDDTGDGGYLECSNEAMDYDDFTPAHEKAQDVCINCPKWEQKTTITGRPRLGTCGQGRIY